MDFYRSGVNLVTGPSPSGLNGQSPSIIFDNGYVPFTTIEDDEEGSAATYYPRPVPHIENTAPHGGAFGESGEPFPSPSPAMNYPFPATTATNSGFAMAGVNHPSPSPTARVPANSGFALGPSSLPTGAMNHSSSLPTGAVNHSPYPSPPPPPRVPPNSPVNAGFASGHPLLPGALSVETRRPGRPRGGRLSAIEQYYRAIAQLRYEHPRRLPGLSDFDAAASSAASPYSGPVHQTAAQPSGQMGGQLGDNMGRPADCGLADEHAGTLGRQVGGQVASHSSRHDRTAAHQSSHIGGHFGLETDSPANRELAGGHAGAPAEQVGGQVAGQPGSLDGLVVGRQPGQPGTTANLAPGNQQQLGPLSSSMSQVAPGFAGDYSSVSSPAGGAHAAHRSFSTASTMMGSCASDQGINHAASDKSSIDSPSAANLHRQPALRRLAAAPPPGPSYPYAAHPQLAGPSPFAVPPHFAPATQFPAPTHFAPAAQTYPPQFAQPPSEYTQAPATYAQAPATYTQASATYTQASATYTQAPTHSAPAAAQQLAPTMPPLALVHDLPASVTERPTFQRILRMATDPKQLPPNVTPHQAQTIQQTQVHLASAKFDKVREANNKSAKRGRYKRMATTVALADEIMRQKAEAKELRDENARLAEKLERVEGVMPGLTSAAEVAHGEQLQLQHSAFNQHGQYAAGGGSTSSSYFDDAGQSYESSHSNALGIMMPSMSDLFGDPDPTQPESSETTSRTNSFSTTLPSSTTTDTTVPSEQAKEEDDDAPHEAENPEDATGENNAAESTTSDTTSPPPLPSLTLDRQFLREVHEMRLQLIDAVKGDKLRELGFGCHEEIDAVIQRGRRIREMLGVADDDWDRWVAPPSNVGRRKRAADDGGEGEEEEAPPKKKGRKGGKA